MDLMETFDMEFKIINTEVFGLERAIIASGFPMKTMYLAEIVYDMEKKCVNNIISGDPGHSELIVGKAIKRATKLGHAAQGSGHDNYLKGITVYFTVVYPQYFSMEFQRYHFIEIISSSSKMHTLAKSNIKEHCNEYVDQNVIDFVEKLQKLYNEWPEHCRGVMELEGNGLYDHYFSYMFDQNGPPDGEVYLGDHILNEKWKYEKELTEVRTYNYDQLFQKILSNLPMGYMLFMDCVTNYQQLKTVYNQRKNHRLDEWDVFCRWIKDLPYFKELILEEILTN